LLKLQQLVLDDLDDSDKLETKLVTEDKELKLQIKFKRDYKPDEGEKKWAKANCDA
jgi:hypothetical protein